MNTSVSHQCALCPQLSAAMECNREGAEDCLLIALRCLQELERACSDASVTAAAALEDKVERMISKAQRLYPSLNGLLEAKERLEVVVRMRRKKEQQKQQQKKEEMSQSQSQSQPPRSKPTSAASTSTSTAGE